MPKKNLAIIGGSSLISHAAECVRNSRIINRTVVSTDSEEIAEHAMSLGLEVPFLRPVELSGDEVTDWPVFYHCLQWLKDNEGYMPDIVVHLRVTSPFAFKSVSRGPGGVSANWIYLRREDVIDKVVAMLKEKEDLDFVRTVEPVRDTPYKMWRLEGYRLIPFVNSDEAEIYNMPRQMIPPIYLQNGYVDAARYRTIMEKKSMNGDKIGAYILDCDYMVDIDRYSDIELGELLYGEIIGGRRDR